MTNEVRKLRVMFNKVGGNASKGAQSTRITLPVTWVKDLGITPENREIKTTYDGTKITIEPYVDKE